MFVPPDRFNVSCRQFPHNIYSCMHQSGESQCLRFPPDNHLQKAPVAFGHTYLARPHSLTSVAENPPFLHLQKFLVAKGYSRRVAKSHCTSTKVLYNHKWKAFKGYYRDRAFTLPTMFHHNKLLNTSSIFYLPGSSRAQIWLRI